MKHSSVDFQTKHESTSPSFPPVEESPTRWSRTHRHGWTSGFIPKENASAFS